jgi:Ala-tRNA(Pro) deacylase
MMKEDPLPMSQGDRITAAVTQILHDLGIQYTRTMHEPVHTMEQADKVSGNKPGEGVKSLLVRTYSSKHEYSFAVVAWRGDRRVDWKSLADGLQVKKVSLASEEEVVETLGITIGAVTPFGYENRLPVVFDTAILENSASYINSGKSEQTIQLHPADLLRAIDQWRGDSPLVKVQSFPLSDTTTAVR